MSDSLKTINKIKMLKAALELAAEELPSLIESNNRIVDSYALPVVKRALLALEDTKK